MRRVLCAAFLLSAALAGCVRPDPGCAGGSVPAFTAGEHTLALCVGDRERTALVHVPAGLEAPVPLLLMLHGGGGSAAQMQRADGMDRVADALGFVVVYAQGTPQRDGSPLHTWNAMHCCGEAYRQGSEDVRFLGDLVDLLTASWPIDGGRIGVAGHSNGAMMAYRVAAERSETIASVMAVSGAIGGEPNPGDPVRRIPAAANPVSVLILHARDDPRVPYDGGQGQNLDGPRVDLAVAEAFDFWVAVDGATPAQAPARDDGVDARLATGLRGTRVLLLTTEGGHGWPGAAGGLSPSPKVPDASQEIGAFLLQTPRAA